MGVSVPFLESHRYKLFVVSGCLAGIAIAAALFLILGGGPRLESQSYGVFANVYPAATKYQEELERLKESGQLRAEDEAQIRKQVAAVSEQLDMPPALLFCLLFQESRLNVLAGLQNPSPAKGIGQFLNVTFDEVNHQLNRYSRNSILAFTGTFGKDIRPVHADPDRIEDIASYYTISTGISATAAYLNNRYHHLARLLEKRSVTYNPEILWAFSAMAYNKGTRSVLSLWNVSNATKQNGLEKALSNPLEFHALVSHAPSARKALRPIWPKRTADRYAEELNLHIEAIGQCAFQPLHWPSYGRAS